MAYVLSSISGNLISAASAGYAPTNGSDVSAIASAYQVVSATATQLNAGTAYVTSINETQLSAARAGNAANASLATSAWYDGTGRLISSLPDSAAVSGIASAYAESAASGKEDAITYGYDTSNAISSINGSALAGGGGGGVDSATVSAIASSYAESAASSKLDESATADFYSTSNPSGFITGVDLAGYATTSYVVSSVSSYALSSDVSATVNTVATNSASWDSAYSLVSGVTALLDAI